MKANVCLYLPTTHGNLRTFCSWKAFSLFEKCSDLERLLGYGLPCTYTNYFFPMFIWKWCSFHISTSDSLWWRWKRKRTYLITLEEFFRSEVMTKYQFVRFYNGIRCQNTQYFANRMASSIYHLCHNMTKNVSFNR